MQKKKFLAATIAFLILSLPVYGNAGGKDTISLKYSFEKPSIYEYGNETYVKMNGLQNTGDGGKPVVPVKPLYILLPQGKDVAKIEVTCKNKVYIGSGYKLKIADYPSILGKPSMNKEIRFNPSKPFPVENYEIEGIYSKRGFNILIMNIYPLHYIKETGEIYYFKDISVKIHLKEGKINPLYRGLPRDKAEIAKIVENPGAIASYKKMVALPSSSIVDSSDEYQYVIITSKDLANSFGQNTLKDLAEFKSMYSMNATIVTVEDIENEKAYWNSTPIFNDTQAKIRNFIRDAYLNWHTDYVLLAGDASIIPPRTMWVEGEFHQWYRVPSDVYYACLDGSYNSDKDWNWGEPDDGEGGGDVDLMAEVYVGRASIETVEEMKNFVKKTIQYEDNYDDYVPKVLLVGEDLGWGGDAKWGGNHLDQLIDECDDGGYYTKGIPSDRFDITKLYDRDEYWDKNDLIELLNDDFHIVCHMGHSNYFYNMRLSIDDVDSLKNDKPFFGYSSGCMAGGFDREDCFAEYVTVKTQYGAFAGIWNTRYGWGAGQDEPYDIIDYGSQRFVREFWDAIFGENIKELGRANQDSKEDNIWRINELVMRFCFYELTLFGDPSAILKDVDFNAPEKPEMPSGETDGKVRQEYTYESMAVDEDGDKLYYMWDFGDETTIWLGPYKSGEKIVISHSWNRRGSYEVRVKAKDIYGRESEWSDPLPVKMPLYNGLYEKIFDFLWMLGFFRLNLFDLLFMKN